MVVHQEGARVGGWAVTGYIGGRLKGRSTRRWKDNQWFLILEGICQFSLERTGRPANEVSFRSPTVPFGLRLAPARSQRARRILPIPRPRPPVEACLGGRHSPVHRPIWASSKLCGYIIPAHLHLLHFSLLLTLLLQICQRPSFSVLPVILFSPPHRPVILSTHPGGIGQPLSLLLKANPLVTEVSQ